jgi:hypothetical protein
MRDKFTADPAPLVVGGRLYLYVGHDEARGDEMFTMREWLVYSTTDMRRWTPHEKIMKVADFRWAKKDAWAAQVVRRHAKYWLYAVVEHDDTHPGQGHCGCGLGHADRPVCRHQGLGADYQRNDAQGHAQLGRYRFLVFTDDDGTSWIAWGNRQCYIARLKPMIELDGPITEITPPHFEEGPWLHKRGKLYYLTYASLDRSTHKDERVSYSTAPSIIGPWTYHGELTGSGRNSFTIHPGIAQFEGKWYLFLHNASLSIGDQQGALGRRAVTAEHLQYNRDGTLKRFVQTDASVTAPSR